VLEQELSRLTERGGGTLTPASVVDAARSEESPLHQYFEWDDSIAAEAYRQDQARELIRRIRVRVSIQMTTLVVPRYVHDASDGGSAGYRPLFSIDTDEQKQKIIEGEMRTAMAHLRRAGSIASVIDNKRLHTALSREVTRIEGYLGTLLKAPEK